MAHHHHVVWTTPIYILYILLPYLTINMLHTPNYLINMTTTMFHLLLLLITLATTTRSLAREVYGNGRIFDITHEVNPNLPAWDSKNGLGKFVWLVSSMKNGSLSNDSEMKMSVHTGTHIDAPGHFYEEYYEAGYNVNTLDLDVLTGPALLIDVPRNSNITAEVMKSLKIPKGVRRVLFRTANTDKKLMFKKEFDSSFTAFVEDGAKWLVENTNIKLVGLDYLSVATRTDAVPVHRAFLKSREIILVEGLKLDNVKAGLYQMSCLPLRLFGAEAAPARCILVK